MDSHIYAEVLVTFLPAEAGGRAQPAQLDDRGYRPHLRIAPNGEHLGVEFVDGPEQVRPGEATYATVRFIYAPAMSYDALTVGHTFEILEGHRVIGHGSVTRR